MRNILKEHANEEIAEKSLKWKNKLESVSSSGVTYNMSNAPGVYVIYI